MASLLLSPDSPAPVGTSAEDGGGGEDGCGVDGEMAESRGEAVGVGPCGFEPAASRRSGVLWLH